MSRPRKALAAIREAEASARSDQWLQIRVSSARKALYAEAARKAGLTLSAWVLRHLDAAL